MKSSELYQAYSDFFINEFWPNFLRRHPDCIPEVRNQEDAETCVMEACLDAIYARMFLELEGGVRPPPMASLQELKEFVHIVYPLPVEHGGPSVDPETGEIEHREQGFANTEENVFKYVKEFGLSLENDYPTCNAIIRRSKSEIPTGKKKIYLKTIESVPSSLLYTRVHEMPIVVRVIDRKSLRDWKKSMGVYMGATQAERAVTPLDYHCLLLVAVGPDSSFFLAKNSWGEDFGFHGYIKLSYDAIVLDSGIYPGAIELK